MKHSAAVVLFCGEYGFTALATTFLLKSPVSHIGSCGARQEYK